MPARDRVLLALKRSPVSGVSATTLCQPKVGGIDWRKRVSELRAMGYRIGTYPIKGRAYCRYRLEGEAA